MRVAAPTVALLLLVAVAGCAPPPPATDPAPGSTQEPAPISGDAPCIEGRWALDLPDFVSQAAVYLKSLNIPLESLEGEGHQFLDVRAGTDAVIALSTDISWQAVLLGNPIAVQSVGSGQGEWGFGDSDSTIEVGNWFWNVAPGVPGADAPNIPVINLENGFSAECSGDSLTLLGPESPLIGHFTRVS